MVALKPAHQTGSEYISTPNVPGPGNESLWESLWGSYALTGPLAKPSGQRARPSVRNYRVAIGLTNQAGNTFSTPLLSVIVESFKEDERIRYQAIWTEDRKVFGFGDSPESAIQDMANFLINDLDSLMEDDGAILTPRAMQRRDYLRDLFGIPA